jgi:hypothetical protein
MSMVRVRTPSFDSNFIDQFAWCIFLEMLATHRVRREFYSELVIMDNDIPGTASECIQRVIRKLWESGSVGVTCVLDG